MVPTISLVETPSGITARDAVVDGLKLRAFFDGADRLLAVLDDTRDAVLPNTMLVLDDKDGRKWDDILKNDFNMDPEIVRPRKNNKYQKLDISYNGLAEYNSAMQSRNATDLREWRMAAAAGLRDARSAEAAHEIELARATIAEAEKTIADLDEFIRLQREKLRDAKKSIGKVSPKESAEKILRYESRIERANAKKARSQRRLRRAEKRIAIAGENLNNYRTITGGEKMADIQPLFTTEPKIIDDANAFKPVSFAPPIPEVVTPRLDRGAQVNIGEAPIPTPPAQNMQRPQAPISGNISGHEIKINNARTRGAGGGAYYLMLMLLIGLSIFTLYLYQKKLGTTGTPNIAATIESAAPTAPAAAEPVEPVESVAPANQIPETIPEPTPTPATTPQIPEPNSPSPLEKGWTPPQAADGVMGDTGAAPIEPTAIPDSIPAEDPFIEPAAPVAPEPAPIMPAPIEEPMMEIEQEVELPTEPTINIDEEPMEEESGDEFIEDTALEYDSGDGTFEEQ
ncbi:MAG: hypothetical protein LBL46_03855 [Rickettsiales bacterium]|jgi:hypothetical protein|nr:hypothetical protein [Rickettsiales bacterium]